MIKLIQAPITSIMMGGLVFLLTMFLLLDKPLRASADSHNEPIPEVSPEEFWKRHNPEIDQLLDQVRKEKEGLAKREADLKELAARLQAERAEINTVTQRVAELQVEFDQNVIRIKEEEVPSLKRMTKLYTTMSPEAVMAILKEMDDTSVVKLISSMKESEAAPLLDAMARENDTQAKRAASLTEALRKTFVEKKKTP